MNFGITHVHETMTFTVALTDVEPELYGLGRNGARVVPYSVEITYDNGRRTTQAVKARKLLKDGKPGQVDVHQWYVQGNPEWLKAVLAYVDLQVATLNRRSALSEIIDKLLDAADAETGS